MSVCLSVCESVCEIQGYWAAYAAKNYYRVHLIQLLSACKTIEIVTEYR